MGFCQSRDVLYAIEEAAELLQCSRSHPDREHRQGNITYKVVGRRRYVHRDEIESYARYLPSE